MTVPPSRTNPSNVVRSLLESEALAKNRMETVEYVDQFGHVTTEYLGDINHFLGKFRPPVSQRVRGWANKKVEK